MKNILLLLICIFPLKGFTQTGQLKGQIHTDGLPLGYVHIKLSGTSIETLADEGGLFSLKNIKVGKYKIVLSRLGYTTVQKTVEIKNEETVTLNITMELQSNALEEVVVSGTMKEISKLSSPIPVEVYTPQLFKKNPSPNIFESLGMVNGVQPQLNCNVCNTGDIHINGMEGPYTMILIDGMPIVSSLATVYGLAGIPNSMVKRIEIVKGPASTLYGSEAVGGLVNIITKDPATSPTLNADVSTTSYSEYNADIAGRFNLKGTNSLVGINIYNYGTKHDINHDNFTDVTQQQRASVFNKWNFTRKSNLSAGLALRYVYENRWGGELQWQPKFRGTDSIYGESIKTNRFEIIGNYGIKLGQEKLLAEYSYNFHHQDSYYGTTKFLAEQQIAFAQIRWNKTFGKHDLLAGIPLRYTFYDDNTAGTAQKGMNNPMKNFLPGIFVQNEYRPTEKLTVLTGLRYDYHHDHGSIFTPRLSFKFSPNRTNTFRLSGGNGYRVVNLFTEDHAALTGARTVIIKNELKPEQSWNANLNYSSSIQHKSGFINLDASVFYTYFTNKIIGDFSTDPQSIVYDNLSGHAISKGITLNTDFSFNSLKIMAGVTIMDVYQVDSSKVTSQQFAPKFSGTYSVSYSLNKIGLSIDYTGRLNGSMYLPVQKPYDIRSEKSPTYTIMNLQVTKKFSNGLEVYTGVKNLLNFIPKNPILRPEDPFGNRPYVPNPNNEVFDPSYSYSQMQGIKGFLGIRYNIK
ncbi:TonB-dependent receptor [Solitalea koreensis]|uniref:Outer membrane receptor for ferrienterochelin and colicins n=1 Tax=Solitalea koreensis TaxID=543615 RepID=A0A521BRD4_9SPHI|nr:TonB-dependent receptor [Solitalea koreensis]SMO49100.1 outer membrane receptor for ferrienterochelin and colicins [Solitalea koreensis]